MKPFNLEEYLKNPNKEVVTSYGRSVKIHCANYVKDYPVIAEIKGSGKSHSYTKDIALLFDVYSSDNLFFTTERKEGWINIYPDSSVGGIYTSEEEARNAASPSCISTIKIEWEE